MRIIIKQQKYLAIKHIAHSNMMTINALVGQIINNKFEIENTESELFKAAYHSIVSVREIGKILNNYTKQINANIKSRKEIDNEFLNIFQNVINDSYSQYNKWREQNYNNFFENFILQIDGDIKKINNRKLTPKRWHQLSLKIDIETEFNLNLLSKKNKLSHNKTVNLLINLFLNQGCFFDNETKNLCGFFKKSMSVIKVNSFQIYRNKKRNATQNEINISRDIIEFSNGIINKLACDPILYSNRKFSNKRFKKTISNLQIN